jgi:hypothetical protein
MKIFKSLLVLFLTIGLGMSSNAQVIAVPVNGQGDKGAAGSTNQNEVKEPIADVQSNAIDIKRDENTVQSNWKIIYREEAQLLKELSQKNIKVNVDSMFDYFNNQKIMSGGNSKSSLMIIPLTSLLKAMKMDSTYSKKIMAQNKIYGTLKLQSNEDKDVEVAIRYKALSNGFTINTFDLFSHVLPPFIVTNEKNQIYAYRIFLETFFTNYPEVIYNCSKSFQRKLELKQYDSLYNMHLTSGNIIDLRPKTENNQNKQTK